MCAVVGCCARRPGKVVDNSHIARPPHPKLAPGVLRRAACAAYGLAWDSAGLLASSVYWGLLYPLQAASKAILPVTGEPIRADGQPTRVAIIGAGASGLSAAWTLHQTEGFDFTVFEKKSKVGGHANTVEFDMFAGEGENDEVKNHY